MRLYGQIGPIKIDLTFDENDETPQPDAAKAPPKKRTRKTKATSDAEPDEQATDEDAAKKLRLRITKAMKLGGKDFSAEYKRKSKDELVNDMSTEQRQIISDWVDEQISIFENASVI